MLCSLLSLGPVLDCTLLVVSFFDGIDFEKSVIPGHSFAADPR